VLSQHITPLLYHYSARVIISFNFTALSQLDKPNKGSAYVAFSTAPRIAIRNRLRDNVLCSRPILARERERERKRERESITDAVSFP